MKPPKQKGGFIRFRVILIPACNIRAPNTNLTIRPSFLFHTVFIQNRHFLTHGFTNRPGYMRPVFG
ncbi:hypothetical protein HanRHA438_Chr09g0396561 [Helianthus annuus]|nr:hypothetical protein HanRHA438_Chr09g0396561 [Helianthus annuus]